MADFFAELKRRRIYRVAGAYAVVAWVLLQLIANVAPILDLPPWVARAFLLLLVIGFPLAIFLAWTREPEGDPTQRAATGSLDWALMGALVVVIALVSYQQLTSGFGTATATQKPGVETAREAASSLASTISIAVLPFTNLSDDAQQQFFSDGMTEEITSALARVPDLRVVARTSAYQFRDQNRDIQSIGQQLGATHFIEGSVRRAGDRVRITAQLIKADDGTHVWAENYERQLTDVFAIQEEIARAIATSLRMPLGVRPGENLVSSRAIDPDSYQQYLRAKALVRSRARGVPQAIEILEPLVARNPDFAPAWAQLAYAYGQMPNASRNVSIEALRRAVDAFLPKGEAAGRRAIQLDPNLPDAYWSLARVQVSRGKFLVAEELYSKALDLDPNYPDGLSGYGNLLANVGRLKEALAMKQQLLTLEPYVPAFNVGVGEMLWINGQNDAALARFEGLRGDAGITRDVAMIYAGMGRFKEAADALQEIDSGPNLPPAIKAAGVGLLRKAPAVPAPPESLPQLGTLGFIYLYAGAPERVLEPYETWVEAGYLASGGSDNALLWHPSYAPLRKTERFKAFVRATGYIDYWRAKGWPEFCRPVGADEFACD